MHNSQRIPYESLSERKIVLFEFGGSGHLTAPIFLIEKIVKFLVNFWNIL